MVTELLKPQVNMKHMTAPNSKKSELRVGVSPEGDDDTLLNVFVISEGPRRSSSNPKTNAIPVATLLSNGDPIPMER